MKITISKVDSPIGMIWAITSGSINPNDAYARVCIAEYLLALNEEF